MKQHVLPLGTLELPDNWEDRTTYQFVSEPDKGLDMPMATGRNLDVNATRTSVMIARARLPEHTTIEDFLKQQTKDLLKALPNLNVNGREPWQHPQLGPVHTVDVTFEVGPGRPVRQLQFYFPTDEEAQYTNLTISCNAARYNERKTQIQAVFEGYSRP